MARADRRVRKALDESYRYWRIVDKNNERPELFSLANSLKTLTASLELAENGEFKLTRQLWRRIQQALFDKLITSFPGYITVMDMDGAQILPKSEFPEDGEVIFHPENCRRADDHFHMEIKHLYPATFYNLKKVWKEKGAQVAPDDFPDIHCTSEGCLMRPVVFGTEILDQESESGREKAYHEWWELYWHAYCARGKNERNLIYKRMDDLEAIWGNLYY